ncbi:LCP family glycopolymer transferase [Actinomadura rudentiformis]|uniref:LytR family transcriptional regulator n=1 Tax=Actinomadura rudentiformis TaxID=359158 RepID=A0A6H9Z4H7_9ACTN|nr:LCP family protein [Actinomadura rudentiformis]KAB2352168.1 LytR family transcriptional regulator [Actinomadura rudentiformis]
MASRLAGGRAQRDDDTLARDGGGAAARGLQRALGLTLASALVWGVAHLRAGRRVVGSILLGAFGLLIIAGAVTAAVFRPDLIRLAVQPTWLSAFAVGILALGLVWVTVVIRSYQIVRPDGLSTGAQTAGAVTVALLCFAVAVPVTWAAHSTYVYKDALTSIFRTGDSNGRPVNTADPWNGQSRVNVLLLGGDAAPNRVGVRTDSMTLASVDTKTGDTVLLGLPRNLESFQLPPGPARDRFPYGFTGDGAGTPGLLNEVYQYAEEHPDLVPGVTKNNRGPELLKATIAGILHQRVDYYILVDMRGFADIVDAIGGVKMTIPEDILYSRENRVLKAGTRTLSGKEALWYGRSRTNSDDYTRMGRQKCIMRAIAKQADPQTVLTKFDRLAAATKRAISTDIPQELLPAFVSLSSKVKSGAQINSLQFVPPLISTGNPDFGLIRKLSAQAVESSGTKPSGTPTAPTSPTTSGSPSATPGKSGDPSPGSTKGPQSKPVSLDATCPS